MRGIINLFKVIFVSIIRKTIEFTFNTVKGRYPNFHISIGSMVVWLAFVIHNGVNAFCLFDLVPLAPSAVRAKFNLARRLVLVCKHQKINRMWRKKFNSFYLIVHTLGLYAQNLLVEHVWIIAPTAHDFTLSFIWRFNPGIQTFQQFTWKYVWGVSCNQRIDRLKLASSIF